MQSYKELINVTFEMTSFLWPCPFWTFLSQWGSRQSKQLSPLRSWVRFSLRTHDTSVKRVIQRSAVVGFLRVLRFSPTGNVDRVGWDEPHTDPSTVAVLRDQT